MRLVAIRSALALCSRRKHKETSKHKESYGKSVAVCSVRRNRGDNQEMYTRSNPARSEELLGASSNRRHQQNFIALLKRIGRSAEKADVLFVDVDIQEAADLAFVVAKVRLEFGELLIQHREEFPKIGRGAGDR